MEKPLRIVKRLILSGGSLVLVIPKEWIIAHDLTGGSEVELLIFDNRVEIRPKI